MGMEDIRAKKKNFDLLHLGKFIFKFIFNFRTYVDILSPAYSGLTNNVSTKLQELKGFPWKEGTGDFVNVRDKQEYIQSYSRAFGVEPLIRYNTRVEKLEKINGKWQLNSTTLIRDGPHKGKHVNKVEVSESCQIFGCKLTSPRYLTQLSWHLDIIIVLMCLIFLV